MDDTTKIFVVGFVTDGGTGGFEWDTDRSRIDAFRGRLIADGDSDVTDVRDCALEQLSLDGNHTREAVTAALDQWPDLWEPAPGEGRAENAAASA